MTTTVIGMFDKSEVAQQAIKDLIDGGFKPDQISLVAQEAEEARAIGTTDEGDSAGTGAVSGTVLGGALGLLVGAGLLLIPGIGPVLAAGPFAAAIGTATATVGAAALGAGVGAAAGGLAGALIGEGIPDDEAEYYAEGVRRGGRLVIVQAEDRDLNRAHAIMERHGAADIRERADDWRASGWTGGEAVATAPTDQTYTAAAPTDQTYTAAAPTDRTYTAATSPSESTNRSFNSVTAPMSDTMNSSVTAPMSNTVQSFDTDEPHFRTHFQDTYALKSSDYNQYRNYYRYGYDLANDPDYAGRDWSSVEPDIRNRWSGRDADKWDQFKDAVRYAWDRARNAL